MAWQTEQLSQRSRRIVEHLKSAWQRQESLSPDALARMIELVVSLPDEYRNIGLQTIAGEVVSSMHLHMLGLVETFQQKAEQEGIRAKHRDETLNETLPEIFDIIKKTDGKVIIRSLDDLAALVNITTSLLMMSKTDVAEEAQSWLYELPSLYYNRLLHEKLVVEKQDDAYMRLRPPTQLSKPIYIFGWPEGQVALPIRRNSDVSHHPVPVDFHLSRTVRHA